MYKCIENPGVISSGYFIKNDFDDWEDNLTEIRYSDMVTDEMVMESMQHLLQKFQPLCQKLRDAWKDAEGKQTKIGRMVKVIRVDFELQKLYAEISKI